MIDSQLYSLVFVIWVNHVGFITSFLFCRIFVWQRRWKRQIPIATVTSVVIRLGPAPTPEVLNSNDYEFPENRMRK